jgi:hypothetical protein
MKLIRLSGVEIQYLEVAKRGGGSKLFFSKERMKRTP